MTSADIAEKEFATSLRGCNQEEVYEFLEAIAREWQLMERENLRLKRDIGELKSRINEQLSRKVALSLKDLSIDGRDVMKELDLDPGPRVGEILQSLLDSVIENPSLNRRETLLERLRAMGEGKDSGNG